MRLLIADSIWDILACPACGAALQRGDKDVVCQGCDARYPVTPTGSLDLRLQQPKPYAAEFTLGRAVTEAEADAVFGPLPLNPAPEVDFSRWRTPFHLTRELMSHFPRARAEDSLMLDLGCGTTLHREMCEHAGFTYVGLDYNAPEAPILGDAHALPFHDESFEFILSLAVLEHIQYPFVMMQEAYRVLRAGGLFLGMVSFLEPFHDSSYYHHTHLGVLNSLRVGGFAVERIAPNTEWPALVALANMALFPRMPASLAKTLVLPLQFIHRLWWWLGGLVSRKSSEINRQKKLSGSFIFVAQK